MKIKSFNELNFYPHDHLNVLYWLFLSYRDFDKFNLIMNQLIKDKKSQVLIILKIYAHIIPYLLFIGLAGRILAFRLYNTPFRPGDLIELVTYVTGFVSGIILSLLFSMMLGDKYINISNYGFVIKFIIGIISGIIIIFFGGLGIGIVYGLVIGLTIGLGSIHINNFSVLIIGGSAVILLSGFTGMGNRYSVFLFGGLLGGLVLGLGFGLEIGTGFITAVSIFTLLIFNQPGYIFFVCIGFIIGYSFSYFRLYYFLLTLPFYFSDNLKRKFFIHPVSWDKMCKLPFPGLYKILLTYYETQPIAATDTIDNLIRTYPSQRISAIKAKTVIIIRNSAKLKDLSLLNLEINKLPEGDKGFLKQTGQIKEFVNGIVSLQNKVNEHDRPSYKYGYAKNLELSINDFRNRVGGYYDFLSNELTIASSNWLEAASKQRLGLENILKKNFILQIFRAGDPIDKEKEAFVKREKVIAEIEKYIMMQTGCPGILLYGRRRVGKSTIIKNLPYFLPQHVICVSISMQNPNYFSSLYKNFIPNIMKKMNDTLDYKYKTGDGHYDLSEFYNYLKWCNVELGKQNKKLIIMVDEFEMIDRKIGEKVFEIGLLDTFRESIQNHRNITWMFVGCNYINRLKNAEWSSYFISLQSIYVNMFTFEETITLLTEPLKNSSLKEVGYFDPSIWERHILEKIYAETAGWPHLVQLVAEICITNLNESDSGYINEIILENSFNEAIDKGRNVFNQLLKNESGISGEWEYLNSFSKNEFQKIPDDMDIRESIKTRELIKEAEGMWSIKVPLMKRYLEKYC